MQRRPRFLSFFLLFLLFIFLFILILFVSISVCYGSNGWKGVEGDRVLKFRFVNTVFRSLLSNFQMRVSLSRLVVKLCDVFPRYIVNI